MIARPPPPPPPPPLSHHELFLSLNFRVANHLGWVGYLAFWYQVLAAPECGMFSIAYFFYVIYYSVSNNRRSFFMFSHFAFGFLLLLLSLLSLPFFSCNTRNTCSLGVCGLSVLLLTTAFSLVGFLRFFNLLERGVLK